MKNLFYLLALLLFSGCGTTNESSSEPSIYTQNISDDNQTIYNANNSRNDFYGHGKLNLTNLLNSVTSLSLEDNFTQGEYFNQQWAIRYDKDFYNANNIDQNAHINPTNAYSNFTGNGVTVAIIDDGFDIYHPEIKDKVIAKIAFDEFGNTSNDVSHTYVDDYHGTAVTGIIASKSDAFGINGIAPDVKLILIKMPVALSSTVIMDMFDYAVAQGADIINCSWGTGGVSDAVADKLNELSVTARNAKGVITVFASGNDNIDMTSDESAVKGVIGVSATNYQNTRTSYSNYGKELDIVAPGGNVLGITTLDPLGVYGASEDEYNRFDEYRDGQPVSFIGTSAAAPVVSGAIALLLEAEPSLTFDEVLNKLQSSSDKISLNLPYLNDMISSTSNTPTISGAIPSGSSLSISFRLQSRATGQYYGSYPVSYNGDAWFGQVTDYLPNGTFTIEVMDSNDNLLATDVDFEISSL